MQKNLVNTETDKVFKDSPDSGHPDCKCSRCGGQIKEDECPIRCWTQNDEGEVDENSQEYRYCEKCLVKAGIYFAPLDHFLHHQEHGYEGGYQSDD